MTDKAALIEQLKIDRPPEVESRPRWIAWVAGGLVLLALAGAVGFLFAPRGNPVRVVTAELAPGSVAVGPGSILDASGYVVARGFVDLGFDTKQKLIEWCVEHARLPAKEYWDNQWIQTLHYPRALAGTEPYATMLKAKPDELIRMFRPEDIHIVVVGGETGAMWRMIGSGPRLNIVRVDDWR